MVSRKGAQRFSVRHFSHRLRDDHGAADFALLRRQADRGVESKWNVGQQIREEGPQGHQVKRGTPTMGGVLIVGSVLISTLLWARLSSVYVWTAMIATLAVRRHRFCRRLLEDGEAAKSGIDRQTEVAGAVADRSRCLGSAFHVDEVFRRRQVIRGTSVFRFSKRRPIRRKEFHRSVSLSGLDRRCAAGIFERSEPD